MQAGQQKKKKPKHFEIITLILQSINVHTAKTTCKRWANDKMIYQMMELKPGACYIKNT